MMTRVLTLMIVLASLSLKAQVSYDVNLGNAGGSASMRGANHPSPFYPTGAARPGGALALPGFSATASFGVTLFGAAAVDDATGALYTTDGFTTLNVEVHPSYPALPVVTQSAVLFNGATGLLDGVGLVDVTGMGCDIAGRRLFVCDSLGTVTDFSIAAWPPVWSGNLISVPGNPQTDLMVGLGFEPSTGNLWSTTSSGQIYNFDTAGVAVGAQPVRTVAVAPFTLTGLAVNRSNGPGSFTPFTTAFHIAVSDGATLYDATGAGGTIALGTVPAGTASVGLATSADLQYLAASPFPVGANLATPSALFALGTTLNTPALGVGAPVGLSPALSLTITGIAPGTPSAIGYDLLPSLPGVTVGAANLDVLFLNPFSPTFAFANVGGAQTISISPLQSAPAGTALTLQAFAADATNAPWGITFAPAIWVCMHDS